MEFEVTSRAIVLAARYRAIEEQQRALAFDLDAYARQNGSHQIGDRIQASHSHCEIIVDKVHAAVESNNKGDSIRITYQGPRVTKGGKPHATARGVAWEWVSK